MMDWTPPPPLACSLTPIHAPTPTGFRNIEVPLPPVQEQAEIVEQITFETKKLDELSKSTESTITLLKERRAALIAAAVTGQIGGESAV